MVFGLVTITNEHGLRLLLPISPTLRLRSGWTGRPFEALRGRILVKGHWDHVDPGADRGVRAKATVIIGFCCLGVLGIIGLLVLKLL
jgi:hypothetical protein